MSPAEWAKEKAVTLIQKWIDHSDEESFVTICDQVKLDNLVTTLIQEAHKRGKAEAGTGVGKVQIAKLVQEFDDNLSLEDYSPGEMRKAFESGIRTGLSLIVDKSEILPLGDNYVLKAQPATAAPDEVSEK